MLSILLRDSTNVGHSRMTEWQHKGTMKARRCSASLESLSGVGPKLNWVIACLRRPETCISVRPQRMSNRVDLLLVIC